jgi:hypothetical protein
VPGGNSERESSVNDMTDSPDTMRWVRRGAAILLVLGWVFIAWINRFHFTAPVVFACLGWLAVIATIYHLFRTGAATVDRTEDDADSTWAKPAGALGELEREKRTLLKAIKEAEFDRDMGKLSRRDADDMIRGYRARAIEVIKEIDLHERGGVGTVREQILREVRARVQLDAKAGRKPGAEARSGKPRSEGAPAAGTEAKPGTKPGAKTDAKTAKAGAKAGAKIDAKAAGTADAAADARTDAITDAGPDAATPDAGSARPSVPHDEELDADSTTALEPRHDEPAGRPSKEATP